MADNLGKRASALAKVRARLDRFTVSRDPAVVLDTAALAEVAAILDQVPNIGADLAAAQAAGLLYWFRSLVLDSELKHQDLITALRLLEHVYIAQPEAVPEEVRKHFDAVGAAGVDNHEATAQYIARLLGEALRTSSSIELNRTVELLRQAIDSTPTDHPAHSGNLSNLSVALQARFERSGEVTDLDEAIISGRAAAAAAKPANHPDPATIFSVLAAALRARFDMSGDPADLDEVITTSRAAVAAPVANHPNRPLHLSVLAAALRARFNLSGALADLDEAIMVSRSLAAVTPADHLDRAGILSDLGIALRDRFARCEELADLDEAIATARAAVAAAPADHPYRARILANLGLALRDRFERSGALADIDEAITLSRTAAAVIPTDHTDLADILFILSGALLVRFERSGALADLDEAITRSRAAVAATPADDPSRGGRLSNLSLALRNRSERSGTLADLDAAISTGRAAVAATPAEYPERALYLTNLGIALQIQFEHSRKSADLDEAITTGRAAVAASSRGVDQARCLSNLALALRIRFELSGNLADLDEAITTGRAAVAATPGGRPDQAIYLSNLGVALRVRFRRSGALADLDEAITTGRAAVAATPRNHADRGGRLSNFSLALRNRFERSGNLADLDEAIATGRAAVAAIPSDHPKRPGPLSNLGAALQTRFRQSGTLADLDEAISVAHAAVRGVAANHPDRANTLSNLGTVLQKRFELSGTLADLDEAIATGRMAVAVTPGNHPDRALYMSNLGNALQTRFERTGALEDLDEGIATGREGAALDAASPWIRVQAAMCWGRIAASGARWSEAAAGFGAAVGLLGRMTPRSLLRSDQEHILAGLTGLGSDAAACCIRAGLTGRAVELLEQGRGVLLGQALDTRTDLTDLADSHPDLAQRFATLRDVLDHAGEADERFAEASEKMSDALNVEASVRLEADQRRVAAEAFEQVIEEIRGYPGFSDFLRPHHARELLAAAIDGPVAIINVSRFGSHALILTSEAVLEPIPLDEVTPKRILDNATRLLTALSDQLAPTGTQVQLTSVLEWLWDAIASAVLGRLGFTGPPLDGKPWPRMWWCLPGLLSYLPLHAAGYHDTRSDAEPRTVIDRVACSYTPTLRALLHARAAHSTRTGIPARDFQVVAVSMPTTAGAADLPGAQAEAAMLHRRFGTRVLTLTGAQATRGAILQALPAARYVHFACHATANATDPSASCLLLADQQQLTVTDVAQLRLSDSLLAYLSACSTAQPGANLPDEVIHLASAFQLAGYQQVIGTLWPIADHIAFSIADEMYANIAEADANGIAHALHAVTRRLRDQHARSVAMWASHIHSGT
jgi:CHAT domain-containing protein/tetratricopeptide (TPR) repeat protein